MIWIVTTKEERKDFVSLSVERMIREVIGENYVKVFEADENEDFSFAGIDDTIFVQTRNFNIIENIKKSKARNNAESKRTIELTYDKEISKFILQEKGVKFPKTYKIEDVEEGKKYFVKPLHGQNSNFVDESSVCSRRDEIIRKIENIEAGGDEAIIEEFIEGVDCTVAVMKSVCNDDIYAFPIGIKVPNEFGILTHEKKWKEDEYCYKISNEQLQKSAIEAFKAVGAKYYMRIDFRLNNKGEAYLIDFNLFPGLGITDHFYKCLMLSVNVSYIDMIHHLFNLTN